MIMDIFSGRPLAVCPLPTCLTPSPLFRESHRTRVPADSDLRMPALLQDAQPHLLAGGTVVMEADGSGGRTDQSVAVASSERNREWERRREEWKSQATDTGASKTNKKEGELSIDIFLFMYMYMHV